MRKKSFSLLIFFAAGVIACSKEMGAGMTGFRQPDHFPAPLYHFDKNPVTRDGFLLGRKLFYDPVLSSNNTISCSSCHIQTAAFSHRDHPVSHGIFDRLGTRNAPPIMNLAWSSTFMWDGGIFDLDLQPLAPISNHVEMDDSPAVVLERLRKSNVYPDLFKKAFGSTEISSARFLQALSQFMVSCISDQSKYDSVMRHQAAFSEREQQGYALFQANCNACHREPLFTDQSFRNNGLAPSLLDDKGRGLITLSGTDDYKFKVPSLRNLGFSAPYMHDGRFRTLDAVLDHYESQVQQTPNLDPLLVKTGKPGIALTVPERSQLLAFLQTLDDRYFLLNKELSENELK